MQILIKSLNVLFNIESESVLKNGDTRYFGFLIAGDIKTFCFLSKKQIEVLEKDFKVTWSKKKEKNSERTNLWTKSFVIETNQYFNIGFIYMLSGDQSSRALDYVKLTKKYPVLDFLLSDRPEIFYGVKNKNYSFKNIANFKFSDFYFDRNRTYTKENSTCFFIKEMKSSEELCNFVFEPGWPASAKRQLMSLILKKEKKDVSINYELVRIIRFLNRLFSPQEVCLLLENHLEQINKAPIFQDISYSGLGLESHYTGVIKYISHFSSFKKKFNELMRFNVPNHILSKFTQVMDEPYKMFKPNVLRASDALHFYNNLSRDYGRAVLDNFTLPSTTNGSYEKEIKALDGLKVKDWTYKIARDYYTLLNWGSALYNCVGNYHEQETYEDQLLIGIFKDNELVYVLNMKNENTRQIGQFKGFKNSNAPEDRIDLLMEPIAPFLWKPESNIRDIKKDREEGINSSC